MRTRGPSNAVACPWCKQPNDFTHELKDLESLGLSFDERNVANCDHCGQKMRILELRRVTVLTLGRA